MAHSFEEAKHAMIAAAQRLNALGLTPATSGNYSVRLSGGHIAITVSGVHKGRLRPEDIMLVDSEGVPLGIGTPSAETALHTSLYEACPLVNAVVHFHSVAAVALTRYLSGAKELVLEGYEMLKAFPSIATHETAARLRIWDNSQDIRSLARRITGQLHLDSSVPAYLVRGHGAYAWGKDLQEAERVVEALEHLLVCEMEMVRLKAGAST